MLMTKKRGRPKGDGRRVSQAFAFSEAAVKTLDDLVERYKVEAPGFLPLSRRLILEALIEHAARTGLPLSELFGVLEEK